MAPPTVRRGLHARVADALIGVGEPDWGMIAGHYERAERFDKAASAYQSASAAALLRGALAEARGYLTRALTQLDLSAPGPDRDRLEMALRLARGRLAGATEGYQSAAAAADYERCLQLGGTDLHNEELFATLAALSGYYVTRADLDRTMQVLGSLATGVEHGRQWFGPVIDAYAGMVTLLRGDFDAAAVQLATAIAKLSATVAKRFPSRRRLVSGQRAARVRAHPSGLDAIHAWRPHRCRNRARARGAPIRTARLSGGPVHRRLQARMVEIAMRDRRRPARPSPQLLAAELSELGERHGFDIWRLVGAVEQAGCRRLGGTRRRCRRPDHA